MDFDCKHLRYLNITHNQGQAGKTNLLFSLHKTSDINLQIQTALLQMS